MSGSEKRGAPSIRTSWDANLFAQVYQPSSDGTFAQDLALHTLERGLDVSNGVANAHTERTYHGLLGCSLAPGNEQILVQLELASAMSLPPGHQPSCVGYMTTTAWLPGGWKPLVTVAIKADEAAIHRFEEMFTTARTEGEPYFPAWIWGLPPMDKARAVREPGDEFMRSFPLQRFRAEQTLRMPVPSKSGSKGSPR